MLIWPICTFLSTDVNDRFIQFKHHVYGWSRIKQSWPWGTGSGRDIDFFPTTNNEFMLKCGSLKFHSYKTRKNMKPYIEWSIDFMSHRGRKMRIPRQWPSVGKGWLLIHISRLNLHQNLKNQISLFLCKQQVMLYYLPSSSHSFSKKLASGLKAKKLQLSLSS